MNELKIKTDIQLGHIEFNNESIKEKLKERMEHYNNLVFTEDDIPDAKKDLAELRKTVKSANDVRIQVKKEFMKPYDEFEGKVKELTGLVEKPINKIDTQLKEYEEQRVIEKQSVIKDLYKDLVCEEYQEYIPLEKIYNTKWENKTTTNKDITEAITAIVDSTSIALTTIKSMETEFVDKALETYKKERSLPEALNTIRTYEKQKAEIIWRQEEAKLAEEQRQKEQEARQKEEEERQQRLMEEEEERVKNLSENIEAFEVPTERIVRFYATSEQYEDIKNYIKGLGIEVGG